MKGQTKKKAPAKKKTPRTIEPERDVIREMITLSASEAKRLREKGEISAYEFAALRVENTKIIIAYQQLAEMEQSNNLLLNISEALWVIAPH